MDTYLHIDYLSISADTTHYIPTENTYPTQGDYFQEKAFSCLYRYPTLLHHSKKGVVYDTGGGAGFKFRRFFEAHGWSMFYGAAHSRILIQLPGEACHVARMDTDSDGNSVGLDHLLLHPANRMTRIDIAGNWRCAESVDGVAAAFTKKTMSDYPRIPSDTGVTQYINAKTSEISAKVYRYEPPHPRSDWLRIEFTLKGEACQRAQLRIPVVGLEPIYKALLEGWGFSRGDMINSISQGVEREKLAYKARKKAGSLKWLYETAIPSIRKGLQKEDVDMKTLLKLLAKEED